MAITVREGKVTITVSVEDYAEKLRGYSGIYELLEAYRWKHGEYEIVNSYEEEQQKAIEHDFEDLMNS